MMSFVIRRQGLRIFFGLAILPQRESFPCEAEVIGCPLYRRGMLAKKSDSPISGNKISRVSPIQGRNRASYSDLLSFFYENVDFDNMAA